MNESVCGVFKSCPREGSVGAGIMNVFLWGTRGSIAVPGKRTLRYGGNTACVEVNLSGGRRVVIDAGTGIQELGRVLRSRGEPVGMHLLITHIHWDHILGFPFFYPIYDESTEIEVDGSSRAYKGLMTLFENRMVDGFFPVRFEELKSRISFSDRMEKDGYRIIGDARIDSIRLQHPGGGLGFRFREGGKTFVFITDNELREDSWEGSRPADFVKFCSGADVLVHDCQYTEEEIIGRKNWGHSSCESVLRMAREAEVKRLVLYHHEPTRSDEGMDELVAWCKDWAERRDGCFEVEGAVEGEVQV